MSDILSLLGLDQENMEENQLPLFYVIYRITSYSYFYGQDDYPLIF